MSGGLRVSGGALRGRALHAPASVRPSSARLREALFSIWRERIEGARVLDLYAGSGAVGLEAASRGARSVLLLEQHPLALRAIARNLHLTASLAGVLVEARRASLLGDLVALAAERPAGFDLVFADPPYRFAAWPALLLGVSPLLAPAAELAVEHSTRAEPPALAGGLAAFSRRRYGESALALYRRETEPG